MAGTWKPWFLLLFSPLESTFPCRSHTRMECCHSSPPCRCTTCIFFYLSPSTGTNTSAPTSSPPGTWEASQVRGDFPFSVPSPARWPLGMWLNGLAFHVFWSSKSAWLVDLLSSKQPNIGSLDSDMNSKKQRPWNQTDKVHVLIPLPVQLNKNSWTTLSQPLSYLSHEENNCSQTR